jgi:hypothetical protein
MEGALPVLFVRILIWMCSAVLEGQGVYFAAVFWRLAARTVLAGLEVQSQPRRTCSAGGSLHSHAAPLTSQEVPWVGTSAAVSLLAFAA